MTNKKSKAELREAFNNNTLPQEELGNFFEAVVKYRGYYLVDDATNWAGPWRNDQLSASMDTLPYAQQGYQTGVRMNQS